ncbi:hypothetical protein SAMN06297280_3400 [Arsukibacterium tuosuense]|uniref:Uncharacterized protein n=1 Tax=Arsukibacterium tuosuense TaxID=1323745 RepID=A0A285JDU1_9GAMM|nr:DUF6361 family protein [Arsukibacterium tuosuense]SNY58432.1 hypothetical protein SAMN06297280_3400 [Arsukibacterium tuosuense]
MSLIGWVDFSSLERERVAQIMSMLQEKGTLDELGIGQLRDAFADKLFPGFSTIQTRAKYFVTLPFLFHDYRQLKTHERLKTPLTEFLSEREDKLARMLVKNHIDDMPYGIIGKDSLDKGVARKPSSVYWNGIRKLSIANTDLSLKEFIRQFEDHYCSVRDAHADDDHQSSNLADWMTKPDGYSPDWLTKAKIELTLREAEFLKDKLLNTKRIEHSIPAQLIKHNLVNEVLELNEHLPSGSWQAFSLHEQLKNSAVSSQTKSTLAKALEFSFVLEGAHIRYNLLIAQRAENSAFIDRLKEDFSEWQAKALSQRDSFTENAINNWYLSAFDAQKAASSRTRQFIENWCQLVRDESSEDDLDQCVKRQAIANKGARCLLKKALNSDQGWVGMRLLEFRWPTAKIILRDIQEGLSVIT